MTQDLVIRTVLGDIGTEVPGIALMHEHLWGAPPGAVSDVDLVLDSVERAVAEVERFAGVGGSLVVEMTTRDYGRDLGRLASISRASGVHVVAATGFNVARFSEPFTASATIDHLVEEMVDELLVGGHSDGVRCGVIKAASSLDGASEGERRVFHAAAAAHRRTGAPISTHTERGTWALEQVELLMGEGVPPARILIGHLDHRPDMEYLREVLATGVYIGLDQFSKGKYLPDAERVELVARLVGDGFANRVALSGDLARRSYWGSWGGGPGFTHVPVTVASMLRSVGVSEADVRAMLHGVPRSFLGFRPSTPSG